MSKLSAFFLRLSVFVIATASTAPSADYFPSFAPFSRVEDSRTGSLSAMAAGASAAAPSSASVRGLDGGSRRWLRHPVSFEADRRPVTEILGDFAFRQGVSVRVSDRIGGTVSGAFAFDDPAEFLDVLCRVKQMNWYFDGGTVHFFDNSELETRLFPMLGKSEETLRKTLAELGVYDPRFEWRSADGGRLLLIQGPEAYLTRIGEILTRIGEADKAEREELAERPREKTLGVFRLKHAWAAEKTIPTGDSSATVPGVADVLRQILGESPLPPRDSGPRDQAVGVPRLAKGTGVVGRANNPAPPDPDVGGAPFIQADTRINAVLIWDYEENMARYREIIAALDHPLELVEIRAAIIDVETDRSRELGFSWEYRGDNANWQNNAGVNVGDNAARSYIPVVGDGLQYATIYTRGLDSLMARVTLMEKDGGANILSRPTVLTQDNTQAVLEHTDTFYVRLQGYEEVDLADIKTGLTLKVTPHVIPGDCGGVEVAGCVDGIQMAVHIVNGSNTADTVNAASVDTLPRVKQSTITTQAVVREGEALVIGGYYNETRTVAKTGVPGLSKIPMIGALFRNKSNIASKSERLFVLSPRIVRLGETPLSPGSEGERLMEASPGLEHLAAPAVGAGDFRR